MRDRYQPEPPPPPPQPTGEAAGDDTPPMAAPTFAELTSLTIAAARRTYYAAAATAVTALQNGRFLGGEEIYAAVYAQATRAWWDLVEGEITYKKVTCDHAVTRVRSWARHYLTQEPPASRPGTLFDHALAHAARMAARDFLATSSQLLIHRKAPPGDGTDTGTPASDTPALATPSPHDAPHGSPAPRPAPTVPTGTATTP